MSYSPSSHQSKAVQASPCDITLALRANCSKRMFCILVSFRDTIVNLTDRESVSGFKVSTLCRSRLIPSNLGQRSPCISYVAKKVKVYRNSHSFFRSVCTSMSQCFCSFVVPGRAEGWFGQMVFRVLFSWIIFQCFFSILLICTVFLS